MEPQILLVISRNFDENNNLIGGKIENANLFEMAVDLDGSRCPISDVFDDGKHGVYITSCHKHTSKYEIDSFKNDLIAEIYMFSPTYGDEKMTIADQAKLIISDQSSFIDDTVYEILIITRNSSDSYYQGLQLTIIPSTKTSFFGFKSKRVITVKQNFVWRMIINSKRK